MRFIPVIELEPYDYGNETRISPEAGDKKAWTNYWKDCLRDSGIELDPVVEGSWFVAIKELDDLYLKLIIEKQLKEHYEPGEEMSAMYGGYFLQTEEMPSGIEPSCCGDLSNIFDWIEAVEYVGGEQKMLWIGHPWLMVRGDKNSLEISLTTEYGHLPEPDTFLVSRPELRTNIAKASTELKEFQERVLPYVQEIIGDKEAEKVSHMLVYGAHRPSI